MPSASSVRSDVRIASSSTSTIVPPLARIAARISAGPRRPGDPDALGDGRPGLHGLRVLRSRPERGGEWRAGGGLHADQPRNALDDACFEEPPETERGTQQQRPAAERGDDGVGRPPQRLDDLVGERRRAGQERRLPEVRRVRHVRARVVQRRPCRVTGRRARAGHGDDRGAVRPHLHELRGRRIGGHEHPCPDPRPSGVRRERRASVPGRIDDQFAHPAPDQPADGHRDAAVLERARRQRALELREDTWSAAQLDQTRHRLAQRHDIRRRQPAAIAPDAARRPVDQRRGVGRRQVQLQRRAACLAAPRGHAPRLAGASAAAQVAHPATMPSREDHRHPRRHAVDRPDLRARRYGRGPDGPVGGRLARSGALPPLRRPDDQAAARRHGPAPARTALGASRPSHARAAIPHAHRDRRRHRYRALGPRRQGRGPAHPRAARRRRPHGVRPLLELRRGWQPDPGGDGRRARGRHEGRLQGLQDPDGLGAAADRPGPAQGHGDGTGVPGAGRS